MKNFIKKKKFHRRKKWILSILSIFMLIGCIDSDPILGNFTKKKPPHLRELPPDELPSDEPPSDELPSDELPSSLDFIKIDFYGGPSANDQVSSQEMGLGDLMWKTDWVTVEVPSSSNFLTYQLVISNADQTVRSLELASQGGEIRFGSTNFSLVAKKELVSLDEKVVKIDVLEQTKEGESSILPKKSQFGFTIAFNKIRNWRDLQGMQESSDRIGSSKLRRKHYKLINDIELPVPGEDGGLVGVDQAGTPHIMTDEGFDPIGDGNLSFYGIFDGCGHRIDKLYINRPGKSFVGLFGSVYGSHKEIISIKDLTVSLLDRGVNEPSINGKDQVGSVAGHLELAQVHSIRLVDRHSGPDLIKGRHQVGGLVGKMVESRIVDSTALSKLSGHNQVGGLVGLKEEGEIVSSSTGSSTGAGILNGIKDLGGLVGKNQGGKILNSYAFINVVGQGDNVGGLVGVNHNSVIKFSYATAAVRGVSHVGGLVGNNQAGSEIINAYSSAFRVSGEQNVGGLVGQNRVNSRIISSYATGRGGGVIITENGNNVGGLVGHSGNTAEVKNSYWDHETSKQDNSAGGTKKSTEQMKDKSTFGGWNFNTIWAIDPSRAINRGDPYLRHNLPVY